MNGWKIGPYPYSWSRFANVRDKLPDRCRTSISETEHEVDSKKEPETQNGTKVRLKGKGFPVYKKEGQFGDLIVTYSVKIPTNLTEAQKELFRQLQSMN